MNKRAQICLTLNLVHVKSAIINNDIKFDYRIQEGASKESNAIALLNKLGYPKCIVDRAKENMNENR